jgi:hypothetical protein
MAQKKADYAADQAKNINVFSQELVKKVKEKIALVENTDIAQIREQKKKNETLFSKGTEAIDGTFEDCVDDFKADVRNVVSEKSRTLFQETKNANANVEQTKQEKYTYTTGWWIFKKEHTDYEEVRTLRTGVIKSNLNELVANLQDTLIDSVEKAKKDWKATVQRRVTSALMEAVENVDLIDFGMLKTALRRLVNNMELPNLDLGSNTFNSSFSGTIKDRYIDRFVDEAESFMTNLRNVFNRARDEFLSSVEKSAKREKMSDMIFSDLKKQLESLEKEIENKKLTLDRLKKCLSALEKAA